jgi:hypothetical protein
MSPLFPGAALRDSPARVRRPVESTLLSVVLALVAGCDEAVEPPASPPRELHLALPSESASAVAPIETAAPAPEAPPREPQYTGELAAIATETSIYDEPRWGARRLGYLRAGAIVRREAEPSASGPRCPEGWYRVEPRGFVCVGALATLDVHHPVARATARPPKRDGLPYLYVLSRARTPPLYARLPSSLEQLRFEPDLRDHLAKNPSAGALPPADPLPDWLSPGSPSLHLGNDWHSSDRVLLGQAKPRSGFALLATVDHGGRRFGVTTGLEVIPLDRTRLVVESRFSGIEAREGLPIGFVKKPGAFRVVSGPRGLAPGAALGFREAVPLTEETRESGGATYAVARDGSLVKTSDLTLAKAPRHLPPWASEGVKWIDVSIHRQTLVAWEGTTPVYATLVSTGVGGTGDPEETHATVQGIFKIYEKHVSVTMDGHEASDPFDLRDVPFVQYFHKGFALHAAYWHDDFGRMRSHGCVNLSPIDAAWLFQWTDPRAPAGWHGVMAKEGSIVFVHE